MSLVSRCAHVVCSSTSRRAYPSFDYMARLVDLSAVESKVHNTHNEADSGCSKVQLRVLAKRSQNDGHWNKAD